jgi:hypothetical protein
MTGATFGSSTMPWVDAAAGQTNRRRNALWRA